MPFSQAAYTSKSLDSSYADSNWTAAYDTPFHSYYFDCDENSTLLYECPKRNKILGCSHNEDVILTCAGDSNSTSSYLNQNITKGNFRLVEADYPRGGGVMGRAEFYNSTSDKWGTICDDNWGPNTAKVFCNSVGLPKNHARFTSYN